jgi:hypothetical protein
VRICFDECHPGEGIILSANVADVHSLGGELVENPFAAIVCADPGDQRDLASEPGNGNGLIGSLSARRLLKKLPFGRRSPLTR